MTEREMLRLVMQNLAYLFLTLAGPINISISRTKSEEMEAHAQIILDLVKKDEEENPNG